MNRYGKLAASALLAFAASTSAYAGQIKVTGIGNATVDDVTLGAQDADALAYSGVNPNQGPNGNMSGFVDAFASSGTGAWSLLGKISDLNNNQASFTSNGFQIGFQKLGDTNGEWWITNTNLTDTATLDLVFAMHASNASSAFLFNQLEILGGQTLSGAWKIEWLKNSNIPGYSNLTLFVRDAGLMPPGEPDTPPGEVPEPASLALVGLGLVGIRYLHKRRNAHS